MWERFAVWLIEKFGQAVLNWTVRELLQRLERSGDDIPSEMHGSGCQCGGCCEEDFSADELGIDPEAEGWDQ